MAKQVAINGFGRIGRLVFRIGWGDPELEFVAINDITTPEMLAHLLKYDSVHGIWDHDVGATENSIVVDDVEIPVYAIRNPGELPWNEHSVDIAVEATGLFRKRELASKHITAGAKKVLLSAPSNDCDGTFIIGVNEKDYDREMHKIISIGSCTTNALVPVVKVLMDNFGIKNAIMTTIHAYTNDQKILDLPHKDLRRARAAGMSIIPTTTGSYKTAQLIYPELKGKFYAISIRVPVPDASLVDLNVEIGREVTAEEINRAFAIAADNQMAGILQYCKDPLVSTDMIGNPHSSIFDSLFTTVLGNKGTFAKILSWYDNEFGFSNRMVDMLRIM
ncbi:type I glyceraldehyde-3-phosphate dehydrogenase [bacterium]|nr:type I glyceraldehyde-3-phosphate dehydrogenase [bacterium]